MNKIVESICGTSETNTALYFNYTSIKKNTLVKILAIWASNLNLPIVQKHNLDPTILLSFAPETWLRNL